MTKPFRIKEIVASRARLAILSLVAISLFIGLPVISPAKADEESEYRLRAAFIFNFIRFMKWPDAVEKHPGKILTICVQGDELAFTIISNELKERSIKKHKIIVKKISHNKEIPGCWILYRDLPPLKKKHKDNSFFINHGVLTIGENPDAMRDTDIIRFYIEDNKLRFEINAKLGSDSGITISSKLLSLARIIRSNPETD